MYKISLDRGQRLLGLAFSLLILTACGTLGIDPADQDPRSLDTAAPVFDTGEPLDTSEPVDTDTDTDEPPTDTLDYDGDGYPVGTDCDDLNAHLNHDDLDGDGSSTCDGDCDDQDAQLNYYDVDSDGVSTCDGDCDDQDPRRSPSQVEVCDDVDNDCDGRVEEDGDGVCGIWWLEGSSWQKTELNHSGSAYAPTTPIEIAFTLEDRNEVWVLTHTTFHVMDPSTRNWTSSGSRDAVFPSLSGVSLQAGYAVASRYHSDGMVYLYLNGNGLAYAIQINPDSLSTALYGSYDMSALPDWATSLAPSPNQLVGSWIDMYNINDWGVGNPSASCGASNSSLQTYMGFIDTSGNAYFYDANWCYQFVAATPASGAAFFTYPGSPPPEIATAITWTGDKVFFFGP